MRSYSCADCQGNIELDDEVWVNDKPYHVGCAPEEKPHLWEHLENIIHSLQAADAALEDGDLWEANAGIDNALTTAILMQDSLTASQKEIEV